MKVSRLIAALLLILALAVALPAPAVAQERPRASARLIGAVGACISGELGNALAEPAYSEELDEGWRIVLMLRGQAGAANQGLQSPPPTEDSVSAVDIYQILPHEPVPDFVDNVTVFLMANERDDQRYVVEIAGFFWLPIRSATMTCIQQSTGGLFTFEPVS